MKKKSLSPVSIQRLKNAGWLVAYLCLTVIIPFLKMKSYTSSLHCNLSESEKKNLEMFLFLFLAAMVLSFIPYKLSKFSTRLEKVIFITIGLLIPFLGLWSAFAAQFMCFGF